MLKIGLTGSIGSGKSTIAGLFRVLGIPVYIADVEARKFLEHTEVIRLIVEMAGCEVLGKDGLIDRKMLASKVFSSPDRLAALNNIIHPRVRNHFSAWVAHQEKAPYIIQEAAIIFESGFYRMFDKIITVAAPEEERISRVMLRDGLQRRDVMSRIENQWSEESKISMSDFVVHNSDTDLAIPQVLLIHSQLLGISETLNNS